MAKYCTKCGNELSEGASFCKVCGAPVTAYANPNGAGVQNMSYAPRTYQRKRRSGNKKGLILGGAAVAAVILLIFLFKGILGGLGGGSYEDPIQTYVKGFNTCSMELMNDAFPEEKYHGYVSSYIASAGEDYDMSIDILHAEEMSKSELDEYEFDGKTPSKGYQVKVHVVLKGQHDEESKTTLPVVKLGGKWCLMGNPLA